MNDVALELSIKGWKDNVLYKRKSKLKKKIVLCQKSRKTYFVRSSNPKNLHTLLLPHSTEMKEMTSDKNVISNSFPLFQWSVGSKRWKVSMDMEIIQFVLRRHWLYDMQLLINAIDTILCVNALILRFWEL